MRRFALLLLGVPLALIWASPSTVQPPLTVLVGDKVGIEANTLRNAVRVAQSVLAQANVSAEWTICPSVGPLDDVQRQCLSAVPEPDLVLWILPVFHLQEVTSK